MNCFFKSAIALILLSSFALANESDKSYPYGFDDYSMDAQKCRSLKKPFASAIQETKLTSPSQTLVENIPENTQVILLGEDHNDHATRAHFPELLELIYKDTEKNTGCLFVELPSIFQKNLDSIQDTSNVDDVLAELTSSMSELIQNDHSKTALGMLENFKLYTKELIPTLIAAKKLGIKIHTSDYTFQKAEYFKDAPSSDKGVEKRNEHIASEINEKIENGSCAKAVSINGAAHLLWTDEYGFMTSIPDKLTKKGVSAYRALLTSSDRTFSRYFKEFCRQFAKKIETVSGSFVIKGSFATQDIYLHPFRSLMWQKNTGLDSKTSIVFYR